MVQTIVLVQLSRDTKKLTKGPVENIHEIAVRAAGSEYSLV